MIFVLNESLKEVMICMMWCNKNIVVVCYAVFCVNFEIVVVWGFMFVWVCD